MNLSMLSSVLTVGVFGVLGALLARRLSRPAGRGMPAVLLGVLLGAAVVGRYVGPHTRLVSVGEFAVRLNWSLVGFLLGGFVGLLLRDGRSRRLASGRPA